jgi:DNA-binding transcriptional regulator YhcF (GntR family)
LPTVRAVAVGLAVSPRAVEQAYHQLEQECFVTWADGSAPRVSLPSGDPGDNDVKRQCARFLLKAAKQGYSRAAVLHAIETCFQEEIAS